MTLLGRTDPPTNDALLKSALVRRSMADVQRVIQIREDKPALQNLLQKGSVGEDIWNSLLAAERELEAEIMEVVAEANTFAEGWGSIIFQTANEMLANEKMRGLFEQTSEIRREKGLWSPELFQLRALILLRRAEIRQIKNYNGYRRTDAHTSSYIFILGSVSDYAQSYD